MNAKNELMHNLYNKSLGKRALQGAGIAFLLAISFLLFVLLFGGVLVEKKAFWEGVWEFFPLVTVTAGGALGGIIYYVMVQVWYPSGWKKIVATIISVLVYTVLLWASLIAGFSATGKWD